MKLVLPRLPAQSRPKQLTRESYNVNIIYNMQIALYDFPKNQRAGDIHARPDERCVNALEKGSPFRKSAIDKRSLIECQRLA